MNHENTVYCGVDVSKDHLDVLSKGHSARFENTVKGVRAMTNCIVGWSRAPWLLPEK